MEFKTTFWSDFTIADRFGKTAVNDTFNRAFREWKSDTVYVTELTIVLNWKIWEHWEHGNMELAGVYDGLWKKCNEWCHKHLKGKDFEYFFKMTD